MESLFNNWNSVVAPVRNDLVFESRNKVYGAYRLRKNHNRNMTFSLLISGSFFILLSLSPTIVSWIRNNNVVEVPEVQTQVIILPPPQPPIEDIKTPEITPPTPPVEPLLKTVAFTQLEASDNDTKNEKIIVQSEDNPQIGNKTQDGEEGTDIIIHEKVVVIVPEIEKPVMYVEQMPTFPGGDEALNQFIKENVSYPQIEREMGISGKCYITFVVEKNGEITDVKILRGVSDGPGYDKEAERVVKSMPKWKPGKQNGKAVRVQFILPINFTF